MVPDWTGKYSPYNSCLPATLAIYSRSPGTLLAIDDAELDTRITELRNSLLRKDAIQVHDQIARLL